MKTMRFNPRTDAFLRARAREDINTAPDTPAAAESGKARRVKISAWTNRREIDVPAYVIVKPGEWPPYIIGDAIARKNRLLRLTLRHEYYDTKFKRDIWVMSIGSPADGGGFNVANEVWFRRA